MKIEVEDLRKGFATDKGALPVVDGVGLQVADGEFIAIVGPSGCGKSTLMRMIAGFIAPDAGRVLIDGAMRSGPSADGILISQHGSVFPWLTVRQNLMFGLNAVKSDSEKAAIADHYAEIVGLKGFEGSYPHELSGGMLKRVELARALAVKPAILYMDEPFSALDALMSLRLRNELLRILAQERHTVLLITHDELGVGVGPEDGRDGGVELADDLEDRQALGRGDGGLVHGRTGRGGGGHDAAPSRSLPLVVPVSIAARTSSSRS